MRNIHSSCRFPSLINLLDYHNIKSVPMAICCNFLFSVRSCSLHFTMVKNHFWFRILLVLYFQYVFFIENWLTIDLCNIVFGSILHINFDKVYFDCSYQSSLFAVFGLVNACYWSITKWTTFRPLILTLHSAANA